MPRGYQYQNPGLWVGGGGGWLLAAGCWLVKKNWNPLAEGLRTLVCTG